MTSTNDKAAPSVNPARPERDFGDAALGMVSTRSFPAIVGTADMMLKSSGVALVGFEKVGSGYCTAVVRGNISDVRIAVEMGEQAAKGFDQFVSKSIIARPSRNLEAVLPIGSRLAQYVSDRGTSRLNRMAVGLIETRGYPALVGAADAMLKAADVHLAATETIGSGLCTAIIRGRVSDVAMAIEAGMHEAERIGELHAVMVIPRPLDDLEAVLPLASCWIETPRPLVLPIELKQREQETVEQQAPAEESHQQQALPEPGPVALPDLRAIPQKEPEDA
jgi:carbon dioxide concentrating mechanism protein CcmO